MGGFKLDLNYRNLIVIAATLLVFALIYKIQSIISIFAISFFLAYLMDPVIDKLEEFKIPRTLGILIFMAVFAMGMAIVTISLFPLLYTEINYLIESTPSIVASTIDTIQNTACRMGFDISLESIRETIGPKIGVITQEGLKAAEGLVSSASAAVTTVLNLAITPIITFYFLRDFDTLKDKLFDILKKHSDKDYKCYLLEFDKILSVYFRGQVIVAAILGVLYTAVLLIVGVKPAVLIGLVSGLLSIVPYLGFMIGFATSLILAIVQFQDLFHPLMVVVGFSVVQAIEGNFITPKIVGESLGLHPTAVIFALLAGGTLFGIGGMIIALPIAAFLKILIKEQLA